MGNLSVFYNSVEITPTPLVNQNYQFTDYGSRWGNTNGIELQGMLTGIQSKNAYTSLRDLFSGQFGRIEVKEGGTTIYDWSGVYVDDINIPQNSFFKGSFTQYNARFRFFQMPSGVMDPTNEYTFSHGDDGVGTLSHAIAAKGLRNDVGAFFNAVNFVQSFSGKIPFGPSMFPSGELVLTSLSENINRAEGIYSVTETYKFNTGSANPYLELFTATSSDIIDNDYILIDTNLRLQASTVHGNVSSLESVVQNYDFMGKLNDLGFNTSTYFLNTDSLTRNSGAATIDVRKSFVSGLYPSDVSGYFDYRVSYDNDVVLPKVTWKVDGEFVCKGPLDYRRTRLAAFKAQDNKWDDLRGYLIGLITGSDVYAPFKIADVVTGNHSTVAIQENTGLAQLKMSLSSLDGIWDDNINNPKYTVQVQPPKWVFDLLPAANIEGHYIIQDLQMRSQGKVSVSLDCESFVPSTAINVLSGYMNQLEAIYIQNGITMGESLTTGFTSAAYNKEWLGLDTMSSGIADIKMCGAVSSDYVREAGYKFGY